MTFFTSYNKKGNKSFIVFFCFTLELVFVVLTTLFWTKFYSEDSACATVQCITHGQTEGTVAMGEKVKEDGNSDTKECLLGSDLFL